MRLIRWSFHNVHMPMFENEQGQLFCTTRAICSVLGIKEDAVRQITSTHAAELSSPSVIESHAKAFLDQHRVEFGIKRLRADMRIWSDKDMFTIAILSRSSVSREFRDGLWDLVKKQATRGYVSEEEHNKLLSRVAKLEDLIAAALPDLEMAASAAGHALQAQKGTKHLRLVK